MTSIYADANYILTGGQDGAVRVWNRRTRQLLIQFNGKFEFLFQLQSLPMHFVLVCETCRLEEGYRRTVP